EYCLELRNHRCGTTPVPPDEEFLQLARTSRPGISTSFQARALQQPFWDSLAPERACSLFLRRPARLDTRRLFAGSVLSRNLRRPSFVCRLGRYRAPRLSRNARLLQRRPRHSSRASLRSFVGPHTHLKKAQP